MIFANYPQISRASLACFALIVCLAGCSTAPKLDKLPPIATDVAPVAPAAEKLTAYTIQVGDVIDIKFPLNPELNETVTVRPDGLISTSVSEDIPAYNLTVAELNNELREAYRSELNEPRVSAVIRSFAPIRVYVSGEVASPGEFVVVGPNLTVSQAIARAGGALNTGDLRRVVVLRRGAGEKTEGFLSDYYATTQEGDASKDARLAPYDVVFVPKSGTALAYKNYQQYFQQYVSPSIGVSATYSLRR